MNLLNQSIKKSDLLLFKSIAFDPNRTPNRSILSLTPKSGQKKKISLNKNKTRTKQKTKQMQNKKNFN